MATVLKSIQVTEQHSLFLYASGAVILRQHSGKFGTLVDQTLCELLGEKAVSLFEEGQVLRAGGRPYPKKSATKEARKEAAKSKSDELLAHQLEIMQQNQMRLMELFQSMQPKLSEAK